MVTELPWSPRGGWPHWGCRLWRGPSSWSHDNPGDCGPVVSTSKLKTKWKKKEVCAWDHVDVKPGMATLCQPCGWQALGAPARRQGCASEVGKPSSGHWSTRDLPAPRNIKRWKSPKDLHLNAKTELHSMASKLQCWTPYAKQLARQEHNPIH